MASYDIIGGIVSEEAKKELQELERMANNIGAKLKGITIGQISKEADAALVRKLNAETEKLVAQEQKLQTQITKTSQASAQRAKATTGYINELEIEVKQLTAAYAALSKEELGGDKGAQSLNNLKNKREELSRLKAAYGDMRMNVGNYSSATKMLGINIGQVLKEMPNFAISMRTGIMSLTNNLPMLAETIKQVRVEQLAMIEAGKKAPSMFGLITKSVFGLTGFMSILMVVLQLFSEDIIKWIGTLFKGEKAIKGLTNAQLGLLTSQETLNKAMKDGGGVYSEAIISIEKHKTALKNAKNNTNLAKQAVDDYNGSLGKTIGEADSVASALDIITAKEKDYIAAMKNMAFANAFFAEGQKSAAKIIEIATAKNYEIMGENAEKYIKDIEKAQKRLEKGAKEYIAQVNVYGGKWVDIPKERLIAEFNDAVSAYNNAVKTERRRQMSEASKNQNMALTESRKFYEKYAEIINDIIVYPKEKGDGGYGKEDDPIFGYINKIKEKIQQLQKELDSLNASELIGVKGKEINAEIVKLQEELEAIPYLFKMPPLDVKGMDEINKMIIDFKDKIIKEIKEDNLADKIGKELSDKVKKSVEDELDAMYDKYKEQQEIEKESNRVMLDSANQITSDLMDIWSNYYQRVSDMQMAVTNEKIKQYEDETEAGIHTQEELSEYKERMSAYQDSIEEEYARKQFRLNQAKAIADIWIAYAVKLMTHSLNPAAIAILTSAALTSTALVASQQLPAFAEGGIMEKSGMAILGDGGKNELAISPSGNFFVSDNKPAMYSLERGTQILPDINRMDLASVLALRQVIPELSNNSEMIKELKNVTNAVRNQKHGNFYGMPLIKQIENRNKFSSRSKSLMN